MKKKIIAIVLCLAITLSVVACGGTNEKKKLHQVILCLLE